MKNQNQALFHTFLVIDEISDYTNYDRRMGGGNEYMVIFCEPQAGRSSASRVDIFQFVNGLRTGPTLRTLAKPPFSQ